LTSPGSNINPRANRPTKHGRSLERQEQRRELGAWGRQDEVGRAGQKQILVPPQCQRERRASELCSMYRSQYC
jgi:hypothetical protein